QPREAVPELGFGRRAAGGQQAGDGEVPQRVVQALRQQQPGQHGDGGRRRRGGGGVGGGRRTAPGANGVGGRPAAARASRLHNLILRGGCDLLKYNAGREFGLVWVWRLTGGRSRRSGRVFEARRHSERRASKTRPDLQDKLWASRQPPDRRSRRNQPAMAARTAASRPRRWPGCVGAGAGGGTGKVRIVDRELRGIGDVAGSVRRAARLSRGISTSGGGGIGTTHGSSASTTSSGTWKRAA